MQYYTLLPIHDIGLTLHVLAFVFSFQYPYAEDLPTSFLFCLAMERSNAEILSETLIEQTILTNSSAEAALHSKSWNFFVKYITQKSLLMEHAPHQVMRLLCGTLYSHSPSLIIMTFEVRQSSRDC